MGGDDRFTQANQYRRREHLDDHVFITDVPQAGLIAVRLVVLEGAVRVRWSQVTGRHLHRHPACVHHSGDQRCPRPWIADDPDHAKVAVREHSVIVLMPPPPPL